MDDRKRTVIFSLVGKAKVHLGNIYWTSKKMDKNSWFSFILWPTTSHNSAVMIRNSDMPLIKGINMNQFDELQNKKQSLEINGDPICVIASSGICVIYQIVS